MKTIKEILDYLLSINNTGIDNYSRYAVDILWPYFEMLNCR